VTVVLVTKNEGGDIFAEAVNAGVQLRSYAPDRSTLEDVFIRSV
jgi:hypothetical protein